MLLMYKDSNGNTGTNYVGQVIQIATLPTASSQNVGFIYQYTGATTQDYIHGYFYQSTEDSSTTPSTYSWVQLNVQPAAAGQTIQVDTIPTASAENEGDILQYVGETDSTYTNSYFYKCVENTGTTPSTYEWVQINVQPGGGGTGGAVIDDNHSTSTTTYSSNKINQIASVVMSGASQYADGEKGLAPKPVSGDDQKALFGDGQYHTIYTSASGSTIIVKTQEADLIGRTATLTMGAQTTTATISASGEAVFTNIAYYGTVTVSADDGNGNVSKGSANLSYFGTYVIALTLNYATINWESTNANLEGKNLTVYIGNRNVGTINLAFVTGSTNTYRATMYVEQLETYKVDTTTNVGRARGTAIVSALHQSFTANVDTGEIYAFKISKSDSNPATCVTPYENAYGCDNLNYTSAYMDFTNDVFVMGSWTGREFFFPRPCMLKYNGEVDYYLNPNDYSQREDGSPSDVADMSYGGNVMVEFPTVYFKRWEDSNYHYCVISDKQLDNDFHAWAHHDKNGNALLHIYLAAYNGSYDGTRLRSISGIACHNANTLTVNKIMSNTTRQQEIDFAQANNDVNEQGEGWYIRHKAEWDMVNDLLLLIGMNTNTQATFGEGRDNSYSSVSNTGIITTGTMNDKGMFWGKNDSSAGVKVFGIENWWANIWTSCSGWINDRGTQKVKFTYGQEDGSTVNGYNTTGSGYITINDATPSGIDGGYINSYMTSEYGLAPKNMSGSQSTYLCDACWYNNSQNDFPFVGGASVDGALCGAFSVYLGVVASQSGWYIGAALSYKPLAA